MFSGWGAQPWRGFQVRQARFSALVCLCNQFLTLKPGSFVPPGIVGPKATRLSKAGVVNTLFLAEVEWE